MVREESSLAEPQGASGTDWLCKQVVPRFAGRHARFMNSKRLSPSPDIARSLPNGASAHADVDVGDCYKSLR